MGQKLASGNKRKSVKSVKVLNDNVERIESTKFENYDNYRKLSRVKSENDLSSKRRRRRRRIVTNRFGYDIEDVENFLINSSIEEPANIPVVLSYASTLYRTKIGGYQEEITLSLGMVVNAVFKNQNWLYVQTPHGEEGYVDESACMPLGI